MTKYEYIKEHIHKGSIVRFPCYSAEVLDIYYKEGLIVIDLGDIINPVYSEKEFEQYAKFEVYAKLPEYSQGET